jgi:GTP 3',8-cyclase
MKAPLTDRFGRVHTNLRVSVTDRCNIRCFYCMPESNVQFKPRSEILTFEEIERLVRVVSTLGINKIRLTGGEPLVRAQLPRLIEMLAAIPGLDDIAMTTNGMLLAEHAEALECQSGCDERGDVPTDLAADRSPARAGRHRRRAGSRV